MNHITKINFGFTNKEIIFIIEQFFQHQKGYRAIAKSLNRNELRVRKQIAQLMSELVA